MVSTASVAAIGSLLGDQARVSMIVALLDGRAWTARELADAAGISPQTASSHLGKLVAGELVRVQRQGRHHYHRLASGEIAALVEQMHLAGTNASVSPRSGPRDVQMRELRSCHDHLAGRIAVELSDRIIDERASGAAAVSSEGKLLLERIGIDVEAVQSGTRIFSRLCVDWSERRPHVAGALGSAIFERLSILGWVKRRPTGRSLIVTATGELQLMRLFGISGLRS